MSDESLMKYERIWIEGLNRGDVSAADAAFAPDCVVHTTGVATPIHGVHAWKELISGILQAFPDLHFTIEDQLVQGDRAAFRWRATGTHTGPSRASRPTGRKVALDGLIVDHLVDGKVQERWEQWDQSVMVQQLGFAIVSTANRRTM